MYTDMSSKNISVREEVYRNLKQAKDDDESFSDVIERLLATERGEHPLQRIVGVLDDEEAAALRDHVGEFRADLDEELERHR